ncbi:MAG: AmmeMemoRadiSam system protein A [Pseudomonadota bacterium]
MDEIDRERRGGILLRVARSAIAHEFGLERLYEPPLEPWMTNHEATFVTLTIDDELRGCIGTIEARRPLLEDLGSHARAAAFSDPRFPPLTLEEYPKIRVEVSVLSPTEEIEFRDEKDALSKIRPFIDGIVFRSGYNQSTFLPQVWEKLPDPKAFLGHLKRKAGLPVDHWSDDVQLFRYTLLKWEEKSQR